MQDSAHYIVVGAGSAGCVLANRLSEDPSNTVILLEAGGRDWSPLIHVPAGSGELMRKGAFGWSYSTEEQADLNGRRMFWPRGKVLGGSSSINGQVFVRGHRRDFDTWAQLGNQGWNYESVLPYFRRSERHLDRDDAYHGQDGPVRLTKGTMPNPLFDAFISAGRQAGFPECADFNAPEPEGFGRYDFNVDRGRRQSSAVAYLRPARHRPNLRVVTGFEAESLLIENGAAVGVRGRMGSAVRTFSAQREVVVSAGTVGSPLLLLASGLGAGGSLRELGIEVRRDLPGVGQNLQDHLQLYFLYGCRLPITIHQMIRIDRAALQMARAIIFRSGPFAHFPVQGGGFTRTEPFADIPDTQWHFGIALGPRRLRIPGLSDKSDALNRDGFALAPCQLRPYSRGSISLTRRDGRLAPSIRPNYLSDAQDMQFFTKVFHVARRIVAQEAFEPFRDVELAPGLAVQTDEEIEAWIRQTVGTCHHQVGTCKMGNDSMAVVDDRLRVIGIDRLRIADASIMPTLVGGNTNAATIMIGEKAADLIRQG